MTRREFLIKERAEKVLNHLCSLAPGVATSTVETAVLKYLLLSTDNMFFCHGRSCRLLSQRVGPGVYEVKFEERLRPTIPAT